MLPPINTFVNRWGPVRYFLAPMAGITGSSFRRLMRELGAQVVISELVSAEGIIRGGKKTLELLDFHESESPLGIQIFGNEISAMVEAAQRIQDLGADFMDINFGCPVKKVVCEGAGAAWLRNPLEMGKLLSSMRAVLSIPLTIKIRTGWDDLSRNALEIASIAADNGVAWVAIHGRTRSQGYSGLSDWSFIQSIAQKSPIPVIGNGDILTAQDALDKVSGGYSSGVMIGRGALKNPWIFQEILEVSNKGTGVQKDFCSLIARHFELAIESTGEHRAFLSLKKFMAWYASGYPNASYFRSRIFSTQDINELKRYSFDYFSEVQPFRKEIDTQPFLMGGHG